LEQARELKVNDSSPQLINNIAVLQHSKGNLQEAQLLYQSAWEESQKIQEEVGAETSDLLITLSYNLGRLEEDAGNIQEAKRTYEGLLNNHPDYVDGIV
jgi:RNA polymerase-associated protein CTR9